MSRTLGIIAGAGSLPELACGEAVRLGYRVHYFPIGRGTVPVGVAAAHPIALGSLEDTVALLGREEVQDLLLVGKVIKADLVRGEVPLDAAAATMLREAPTGRDDDLLRSAVAFLERGGFTVRDQRDFLSPYLAAHGRIAGPPLPESEVPVARFAFDLAKGVGDLDLGQTVVVKGRVPVAVEVLEGTDAAIRRGGEIAGPGCLVAKVAKPRQDFRFDVPTVGVTTIETMRAAGARVLVVEAGAVLVADPGGFSVAAGRADIAVWGFTTGGS